MGVVTEISNFNIDLLKVPLAIMPLGTGNNISKFYGWGNETSDLISDNYAELKKFVSSCLSGQVENLDIWTIEAQVWEYGKFQRVQNSHNEVLESKTFTRHFSNYFSLGIDPKIGYSFDMHRTGSRMGNFITYAVMGCIKSFTKTQNLGELISQFKCATKQDSSQLSLIPMS